MNAMNEKRFGYQEPPSLSDRLKQMGRDLERYRAIPDMVMVAQTLVSMSSEIVEAWECKSSHVDEQELKVGLEYKLQAAEVFDGADRPLEGWQQRAKFLDFLRELNPDGGQDLFDVATIDEVKLAMERFGDQINNHKSSISNTPRYIKYESGVLSTNARLRVSQRGSGGSSTDGSEMLGV
jgi:hypothetical protein